MASTSKRVLTKLSDFISMADIFNDPIYLNMKGRRKLATSLGGILSAGLIVFLLCLGILQSVSMFSREDPQVYQISELEDDPTAIYLNGTNNFMFAIAISEYSQLVNMSLNSPFSFTITFNQYIRFTNGTRNKYKNKINLAPCTADMFPSNIYGENVFSSYELAYAYCPINIDFSTGSTAGCPADIKAQYPDCKTPLNLKVSGSYLSIDFEFIQFNLNACKSTDKLPVGFKCTTENVTALLNSREYKVNLFYANSVTNPMFYKTPNKTYIETIHWDLNPLISKVADIFVDKEISQDFDSYWSTTSYQNKTFYSCQPDKMRELQVFQTTTGSALLQWNIRRSSVNIVTTRTYSKIQDVMTDLGGFSKAVMFIAAFIAVGYVEYKYQLTLSNEFYDFQMDEDGSDKKKKSKKGSKKGREDNYKVDPPNIPFAMALAKETVKKEEEPVEKATKAVQEYFTQQHKKRQGINFGLIKYFKMVARWLSCRRNAEDEVAEKARNLVQDELDIIRVIQKLKEIDKLKVLLLNRYQREVFNFIEKPLVTLDSEKPIHLDSMLPDLSFELNESGEEEENQLNPKMPNTREEYDALPKYAKLYMAYRYLTEDKHSGNQKYNKKLMDMIGDDLIAVFNKVDLVMDDNPDPRKFDEMIKTVFKCAEENDAE